MTKPRIGIIVGSTRPGRLAESVARWVLALAAERDDAEFDLVDLADHGLPVWDEEQPPATRVYTQPHTLEWSRRIAALDGYVFVTPEYNHSIPGVLKNAIDYLHQEWNNKAAGFVSYGFAGGVRSVEHLRGVMGELAVADVRAQVTLSLSTDFVDYTVPAPAAHQEGQLATMLDQVVTWSAALKPLHAA